MGEALAKDIGIAVILLCQLNRETEKTSDRRPELAHLRDSGEIVPGRVGPIYCSSYFSSHWAMRRSASS